jgi:hypothetical protein
MTTSVKDAVIKEMQKLSDEESDVVMRDIASAYASQAFKAITETDNIQTLVYRFTYEPLKGADIAINWKETLATIDDCLGLTPLPSPKDNPVNLVNAVNAIKASLADATVGNPQREVVMREIFTAYAKADLANVREDHRANELIYTVSYKPRQTADIEIDWDAMSCVIPADDESYEGNIPDDKDFELLKSDDASMRKTAVKLMLNYFKSCTNIHEACNAVEDVMQGLLDMHLQHYKIVDTDAAEHACIEATALGGRCEVKFTGDVQFTDDDASDASETAADTVKPATTNVATVEPTAVAQSE